MVYSLKEMQVESLGKNAYQKHPFYLKLQAIEPAIVNLFEQACKTGGGYHAILIKKTRPCYRQKKILPPPLIKETRGLRQNFNDEDKQVFFCVNLTFVSGWHQGWNDACMPPASGSGQQKTDYL